MSAIERLTKLIAHETRTLGVVEDLWLLATIDLQSEPENKDYQHSCEFYERRVRETQNRIQALEQMLDKASGIPKPHGVVHSPLELVA